VTNDVQTAIKEYAAGKVNSATTPAAMFTRSSASRASTSRTWPTTSTRLLNHLRKMKPATSKGTYFKKAIIKGSMTPAVQLEVH